MNWTQYLDERERTMAKTPKCPECGGHLTIDPECIIEESQPKIVRGCIFAGEPDIRVTRKAPAALCDSCEFCIEIEVKK